MIGHQCPMVALHMARFRSIHYRWIQEHSIWGLINCLVVYGNLHVSHMGIWARARWTGKYVHYTQVYVCLQLYM